MLPEQVWLERLVIEGKRLKKEEPTFEKVNNRWDHWRGTIIGTGIYDEGVFSIDIKIPREYPFYPPKVKTLTKIWHPNFFRKQICVGLLGEDWTPANSLVDLVETIRFLLTNPNPADPLNATAARQYRESFDAFVIKAKEWVKQHATWEEALKNPDEHR